MTYSLNEFKVKIFPKYDHETLLEDEMEEWLNSLHLEEGNLWNVQLANVHVRRDDGTTMIIAKRWRREGEGRHSIRTDRDEFGEEDEIR